MKRRATLFRALHAEALKRGLDHAALSDVCKTRFGVQSMAGASDEQLLSLYKGWTGKSLRRTGPLPKRGYAHRRGAEEMISAEDIQTLANAFALRGWGPETQANFVRRQLGRDQIRTRRDFWRVFNGLRAMNRREGIG